LPVSAILIGLFSVMVVKPWTRRVCAPWDGTKIAGFSMGVFLTLTAATVILAYLLAVIFPQIVGDARGLVVGRFDQRNALVVGFVMGFAIIPLIYTISEDALSAVPNSLRAASLGSGATPWQTAVLVVLPVATSGVFSAIMIGLGRAVGETMIILMATGNTPVMTVNPFEGFRTLSASIAQELSDAIQGSSHYRVLFLAALILFSMTFVLNTCAEVVRARFRKKTMQL
jgi:phosphate transport system permease protein